MTKTKNASVSVAQAVDIAAAKLDRDIWWAKAVGMARREGIPYMPIQVDGPGLVFINPPKPWWRFWS